MTQFNGFGGCTKCLQLGESLETVNGIANVYLNHLKFIFT